MEYLTVIKAKTPDRVCKIYSLDTCSSLVKRAVANISEARAQTLEISDAQRFVKLLKSVTENQNLVLCAGIWRGSQAGQQFEIFTENKLCDLLGSELGKVQGGVIKYKEQLISARLARGIDYSSWLLLDADNPFGMPSSLAKMSIPERLQL